MDKEYKIKDIGRTVKPWNSQYGPMLTYLVQLEGDGEPVQINKKDSSPKPQAGDVIYGHVEDTEFGRKFKAGKNPNFSGGSSGGASKSGGYQESPEKQAAIQKQTALKAAVASFKLDTDAQSVLDRAEEYFTWLTATSAPTASTQPTSLKDDWEKASANKEEIIVDPDDNDEQSLLDSIPF